jgi:hypothetical protein
MSALDDVLRWRESVLVHAGFQDDVAAELAADARYDLHALLSLVDCGCPPKLAARILAPLSPSPARPPA